MRMYRSISLEITWGAWRSTSATLQRERPRSPARYALSLAVEGWYLLARPRAGELSEELRVSKEELVHLEGEVVLIAKGGNFRVKLESGHEVLAKLAGKVRRHRIRVVLGDRVTVAVSPYDPTRGFIVYRQR